MHILFDEAGKLLTGRLMSEAESSLQVELDSGKRVKVKAANTLLRFEKPAPAQLMQAAQALADTMELDLAYEFAPEDEFGFAELAAEYFSASAGASGGMSEEVKAELREKFGLDKPLWTQLGLYLAKVATGDLGYSYFFNLPVATLIAERVPATLLLVVSAVLGAFVVGTTLGVLSSRKPNGLLSQLVNVVSLVGFAAPVFWTGMLLVILFASVFPWFPISGMRSVELATDAHVDAVAAGIDRTGSDHLVLAAQALGGGGHAAPVAGSGERGDGGDHLRPWRPLPVQRRLRRSEH